MLILNRRIIPVSVEGENNATYRLNEDLKSYLNCRVRSRDKNLFVANQVRRSHALDVGLWSEAFFHCLGSARRRVDLHTAES